jgi:hypothetical protein
VEELYPRQSEAGARDGEWPGSRRSFSRSTAKPETVLFYQALWLRAAVAGGAIVLRLAAGLVVLLAVIVLMFRYGKNAPAVLRVTGILLGFSSAFAWLGIAEPQKMGGSGDTPRLGPLRAFPRSSRRSRGSRFSSGSSSRSSCRGFSPEAIR